MQRRYIFSNTVSNLIGNRAGHANTRPVADFVSPVMLLVDDQSNGYRHIILPLAVENVMVRRAVCVVASFHLSVHQPHFRLLAEGGRAAIISKLKAMAIQGDTSPLETWATIVLLFVGELVNGSDDILLLYRALVSFASTRTRHVNPSTIERFLHQQTQLLEFFTLPVLSETGGVRKLLSASAPVEIDEAWPPSLGLSQGIYDSAYLQARSIFILRAQSELTAFKDEHAIRLVASLYDLLVNVDAEAIGAHALVWPYFVAAAESTSLEHRAFFQQRLDHIWTTTRYRNVKVAMDALPKMWEQRGNQRWTKMLQDVAMVIM